MSLFFTLSAALARVLQSHSTSRLPSASSSAAPLSSSSSASSSRPSIDGKPSVSSPLGRRFSLSASSTAVVPGTLCGSPADLGEPFAEEEATTLAVASSSSSSIKVRHRTPERLPSLSASSTSSAPTDGELDDFALETSSGSSIFTETPAVNVQQPESDPSAPIDYFSYSPHPVTPTTKAAAATARPRHTTVETGAERPTVVIVPWFLLRIPADKKRKRRPSDGGRKSRPSSTTVTLEQQHPARSQSDMVPPHGRAAVHTPWAR